MKRKESQNAKRIKTWWLVVFLAGILLAQLLGSCYSTDNLLDAYHLNYFAGQKWNWKELFWNWMKECENSLLEYCMDKGQVLFYPFYSLPYIVPAAPDEGAASGAAIFDWDLCRGLPV